MGISGGGISHISIDFLDHRYLDTANQCRFGVFCVIDRCHKWLPGIFYNVFLYCEGKTSKKKLKASWFSSERKELNSKISCLLILLSVRDYNNPFNTSQHSQCSKPQPRTSALIFWFNTPITPDQGTAGDGVTSTRAAIYRRQDLPIVVL